MINIFISHATEDKDEIARPLAKALLREGFDVWFDEFALTMGDGLRESIDEGLHQCDFGVVVFSPAFFAKQWTKQELDGLFSKELASGKTILPVWHKVSHKDILDFSSILANRLAANSADGIEALVARIHAAVSKSRRRTSQTHGAISRDVLYTKHLGSQLKNALRNELCQIVGTSPEMIRAIAVHVHGDASGLDESNSYGELEDGTRIYLRDNQVDSVIASLSPSLSQSFALLGWAVDGYVDDENTNVLENAVCAMRLRVRETIDPGEIRQRLNEIFTNQWTNMGEEVHQFNALSLLDQGIVRHMYWSLLQLREFELIEKLIFDDRHPIDFTSFTMARHFLDYVETNSPEIQATKVEPLLQRLSKSDEPLNDYHKKRIPDLLKLPYGGK